MNEHKGSVVVTGGAGFIGRQVVRALLAQGYRVNVFDSLVSGSRNNVSETATLTIGDIRDLAALTQAFAGVDAIVHLAAQVSVPVSIAHPEETYEVNVTGTRNVIIASRSAHVKRIVYASSAAVYGNAPKLPKREDMPLDPQSSYAQSKVENETDAKNFPAIGLRFFNVYGPGQRSDHAYASVIPRFIAAAREGKPLTLTGAGSQTRDFVHVADVARAVVAAIESNATGVCNIASGQETKISELIELVRAVFPVEVVQLPKRPGDILHSVADISLAKEVFGWSPTITFSDGIHELLDAVSRKTQ